MANDQVQITKPPAPPAVNLRCTRDGNTFKFEWGKPSDAEWNTDCRWEGVDVEVWFTGHTGQTSGTLVQSRDGARYVTGDHILIQDLGITTSTEAEIDRDKWYPVTVREELKNLETARYTGWTVDDKLLVDVLFGVKLMNSAGETWIYHFTHLERPKNPVFVGEPTMNPDTQAIEVECTIEKDDKSLAECYDLAYDVFLQTSFGIYVKPTKIKTLTTSTEESTLLSVDLPVTTFVSPGEWKSVTFRAWARGLAGDSEIVQKRFILAHPNVPYVSDVIVAGKNTDSPYISVSIKLDVTETAPVTSVKLQRLYNTTVGTSDAANSAQGWTDVEGAVDNGNCLGFVDYMSDAVPESGKHTFYRVVAENGSLYRRIGPAYRAERLEGIPAPVSDDDVAIIEALPGGDGTSIKLLLGWNTDDSSGTEVSWSEFEDAWESTSPPSTYNVTWEDSPKKSEDWDHTASLTIRGLDSSLEYYIKARRYSDADEATVYSDIVVTPPQGQYPLTPAIVPTGLTLYTSSYCQKGKDLSATWSFIGDAVQEQWKLYVKDSNDNQAVAAEGTDSTGAVSISALAIESYIRGKEPQLTMSVSVFAGGIWTTSDEVTVTIIDAPVLTVASCSLLRHQPMVVYVMTDDSTLLLNVKIRSTGTATSNPDGGFEQLSGDIVWSTSTTPNWFKLPSSGSSDELYGAAITAPLQLDFRDGIVYNIQIVGVSRETDLETEEITVPVAVNWTHKAERIPLGNQISVDPSTRTVSFTPQKPTNWVSTDLFDVYRVTADSVTAVASGLPFGVTVHDRYAPYAKIHDLAYRVATRTADNDVEWGDISYHMHCPMMRFDWDVEEFLEVPYNLEISDSYTKDFESRTHIDGTTTGYWNEGVTHKGSLRTKLIRLSDPEQIRKVNELAKYNGPVFVRLPNGLAYTADVTVNSIANNYSDLLMDVSFEANEIAIVDQFAINESDDVEYPQNYVPVTIEDPHPWKAVLLWDAVKPGSGDQYSISQSIRTNSYVVYLYSEDDGYSTEVEIPATLSGSTVTIGTISGEAASYINSLPSTAKNLLVFHASLTSRRS